MSAELPDTDPKCSRLESWGIGGTCGAITFAGCLLIMLGMWADVASKFKTIEQKQDAIIARLDAVKPMQQQQAINISDDKPRREAVQRIADALVHEVNLNARAMHP